MRSDLDAEQEASKELQPDEKLVWAGRPIPARMAWSAGRSLFFVFGLFWTAFSIYWTLQAGALLIHPRVGAPPSSSEIAFILFGVPFIFVGIIILCMPYWAYRLADGTVYAVTSKRLLIIAGLRTRSIKSIFPESTTALERRERSDGSGDLIFRSSPPAAVGGDAVRTQNGLPPGFFAIAGVRNVEEAIRGAFPNPRG